MSGTTDTAGIALAPDQLNALVQAVAQAVADRVAPGRASFSVHEVALRNGFSDDFVYREVREGRLPAFRPGARSAMRVLAEHERTWLHGQREPGAECALGVDPAVAVRNGMRRRGK